jgi:transmembrane sensor
MEKAQQEAAAWFARLQAPDCNQQEQAQFRQWLQQHPHNTQAYAAVETLLGTLDTYAAGDSRLQLMADKALALGSGPVLVPVSVQPPRPRWSSLLPLATAATIVLAIFISLGLSDYLPGSMQLASFNTAAGERRELSLEDGSVANLDVDSAFSVTMRNDARNIRLQKGRALFEVAHDRQRPFSVIAGETRVIALGTRFQVQLQDNWVIVTLEEGSVEVVSTANGQALNERLIPGEQLRFEQGSNHWFKTVVETDSATSWSRGRHVFRNVSLGAAIEEVNRYANTKLQLGDPALAALTVSGNFRLGESSSIAAALEAALPLRVVNGGHELLLFPEYETVQYPEPDRAL